MDKNTAIKIIRESFEHPFEKDKFIYFIKNLLKRVEEEKFSYKGIYLTEAYKPYISRFERIGKYLDPENKKTWELIEETLKEQKKEDKIEEIKKFRQSIIKPFFLWKLHFSEIFQKKGGFDIVIANPPYVRADSKDPKYLNFRRILESTGDYKTLYEKWDIFVPFIEKSFMISNDSGKISYIVSDALCTSKYAFKLLDYIQLNYYLNTIDYFEDMKVFEAVVNPIVLNINKKNVDGIVKKIVRKTFFENIILKEEFPINDFKNQGRNAFRKDFFPIKIKIPSINLGDICYISYGLRPNSDERYWKGEFKTNDVVRDEQTEIHSKPFIEGKDIEKYTIKRKRFLEWGTERVPKKISRPTFSELYRPPKIIRGRMNPAVYDNTELICSANAMIIKRYTDLKGIKNRSIDGSLKKHNIKNRETQEVISSNFDLKYLLALINSRFAYFYLNNIRRHKMKNYFYPDDIRELRVPEISQSDQEPFIELVDKIMNITEDDDYLENPQKQALVNEYEREIDRMVYKLYDLTPEEIEIIEKSKGKK